MVVSIASIYQQYVSQVALKDANFALEVELIITEIYKKLDYCEMMAGEYQRKITRGI